MKLFKALLVIAISLVVGSVVFIGVAQYIGYISIFTVSGPSMEPSLKAFQGVVIMNQEKLTIEQIVFFHKPEAWIASDEQDKIVVKRIVAVPGDKVEFNSGKFLVNGKTLFNSKIENYDCASGKDGYSHILEGNQILAFGDNANNSFDSRRVFCDGDSKDFYVPTGKIVAHGTIEFLF